MEISELQKDLAAVFRWTARLNMNEGIANHFSACIPNSNDFYVNGSGMHFSSIKASDMILVKQNMIEEIKKQPELVDPTALNIHGAIHKKVPHARCILHVHSKYATALSTLKNPTLEPIDQNTMRFYNRIAIYDDFGGLGFEEESNKMAAAIGNNRSMLLANHGILTVGETVADAFDELYYFEKACETYITALSTNKELNLVEPKIAEKTAQEWENYPINMGKQHLKAIRLILDNENSDYKN
ncbi:class II aldolase/adducin family protein [Candidatus Pelagibacter sp.]|nr:class II aldolase/adducin family protein [Candidatus Pelagibacter sp.]